MADIRDKYRILGTGAGWFDKSPAGRIRFDGAGALAFLHALVSNDIATLSPDRGVYATYLTPQGRLLSDLYVYHRGDHLLAVVPPKLAPDLSTRLDQLIFSEDVRVSDVTSQMAQIAVVGAGAASIAAAASSIDIVRIESLAPLSQAGSVEAFVARTDETTLPSYDFFLDASRRDDLVADLERHGVVAIDAGLRESLRIDARRPEFGVDMTTETIPLEAGLLERAISTSKGCYVGQEVIIRVLHRGGGRVAKRLVALALDPNAASMPAAASAIQAGGRDVGRITSAAWSPHEPRVIALGYVHRDHADVGGRVTVDVEGRPFDAEITGFAG